MPLTRPCHQFSPISATCCVNGHQSRREQMVSHTMAAAKASPSMLPFDPWLVPTAKGRRCRTLDNNLHDSGNKIRHLFPISTRENPSQSGKGPLDVAGPHEITSQ